MAGILTPAHFFVKKNQDTGKTNNIVLIAMKFDTDCLISYNSYKECMQEEQEMVASKNSILNSKTGKSVVVAFDHGIGGKIYSPNPRTLAEKFIAAQPDGVLMSPPLIHLCADLFVKYPKVVPIATLVTLVRKPKFAGPTQIFDFDFAIEMGARAIKNILVLGQTDGAGMLENMKNTAYLAQRARQKGNTVYGGSGRLGRTDSPGQRSVPGIYRPSLPHGAGMRRRCD